MDGEKEEVEEEEEKEKEKERKPWTYAESIIFLSQER